jgi:hypothetical protein
MSMMSEFAAAVSTPSLYSRPSQFSNSRTKAKRLSLLSKEGAIQRGVAVAIAASTDVNGSLLDRPITSYQSLWRAVIVSTSRYVFYLVQ